MEKVLRYEEKEWEREEGLITWKNQIYKRLDTIRRHYSRPSWQKNHWTPQTIQDAGIDHQELLVALHSIWHLKIRGRVSALSTSKNEKCNISCTSTTQLHTRTTLGTHHCRLHHRTTDITSIWCNNGGCWLIHQVCDSHSNNRRNLVHENCQTFPWPCVETVWNPQEGDQQLRTPVLRSVHERPSSTSGN